MHKAKINAQAGSVQVCLSARKLFGVYLDVGDVSSVTCWYLVLQKLLMTA